MRLGGSTLPRGLRVTFRQLEFRTTGGLGRENRRMGLQPEWFEAVGTVGATVLAGGALVGQLWDRRREVARGVNGWTEIADGVVLWVPEP